jgi:hypothetical protein
MIGVLINKFEKWFFLKKIWNMNVIIVIIIVWGIRIIIKKSKNKVN